jgi:hypothetical protein
MSNDEAFTVAPLRHRCYAKYYIALTAGSMQASGTSTALLRRQTAPVMRLPARQRVTVYVRLSPADRLSRGRHGALRSFVIPSPHFSFIRIYGSMLSVKPVHAGSPTRSGGGCWREKQESPDMQVLEWRAELGRLLLLRGRMSHRSVGALPMQPVVPSLRLATHASENREPSAN